MHNDIKGINLLELLIVIVIIAILVALAIPTFTKTIEVAKDKEAWTNLRLIRTGEKIYHLEQPYYYPHPDKGTQSDIDTINTNLRLKLESEVDWDYQVESVPDKTDFTAKAIRKDTSDGWQIQKGGAIGKIGQRPSSPPPD